MDAEAQLLDDLVDKLTRRGRAASDEEAEQRVRDRLVNRVEQWKQRRACLREEHKSLVYERVRKGDSQAALIIGAEAGPDRDGLDGAPFVVPNSMREVQPRSTCWSPPIRTSCSSAPLTDHGRSQPKSPTRPRRRTDMTLVSGPNILDPSATPRR
ncbi:hypothetical protein [Raineyella fluvialis]|uniref:hypothetical protein n=1 Tax=Raineyella fluvialis TaxID=2662261 RepID=UPI001E5048FB|nr:hypothetical protein [Raineyella fluvialis]